MAAFVPNSGLTGPIGVLLPEAGLINTLGTEEGSALAAGSYTITGQSVLFQIGLSCVDGIELADSSTPDVIYKLLDSLGLADEAPLQVNVLATMLDAFTWQDVVKYIAYALATDGLDLADSTSLTRTNLKIISDMISLADQSVASGTVLASLVEALVIQDLMTLSHQLTAADVMELADSLPMAIKAYALSDDDLALSDTLSASLVFVGSATDSVTFSDTQNVSLVVALNAVDGVLFAQRIPIAEDEYQMWVVNADNIGVTQYTNMPFNSISTHSGTTLGLTETGLYELSGETDDSTEIDAYMRTGHLTFGSTQNKAIDRAYLYVKSDQDLYVKTISDHDGTRHAEWYKLVVDDKDVLRTRLLRTKREVWGVAWSFQIENIDGGSLDLRGVEVMPVLLRRTN